MLDESLLDFAFELMYQLLQLVSRRRKYNSLEPEVLTQVQNLEMRQSRVSARMVEIACKAADRATWLEPRLRYEPPSPLRSSGEHVHCAEICTRLSHKWKVGVNPPLSRLHPTWCDLYKVGAFLTTFGVFIM
ncbi:hypothetical protein J6590_063781 [Homalodisca vitripennis]|nr:hypothetical protein J6590_063781 [Homalodisca vitripennis]